MTFKAPDTRLAYMVIPMYIARIPNRNSRPTYLIREGRRVGRKVVKSTLLNVSVLPEHLIEDLRILLRGGVAVDDPEFALKKAFYFNKSTPHGHVAAVLGTMRSLRLPGLIDAKDSRRRRLVLAMIAARIISPKSKLATSAALHHSSCTDTLGAELGVDKSDEDDLYDAMEWLLARKSAIERRLARRHLTEGALLLCDVTSTYVEGKALELAKYGYSRDRKKGKKQIVLGLLCNAEGCPVGIEVFAGNTGDPDTLTTQINKIQQQFGLKRVVLVGDRGLLTEARIRQEVRPAGFDWISALRKSGIRKIVEQGPVQMSLFDERDLVEVTTELYPGERIVLCRNPLKAEESAHKREALLQATEKALEKIVQATRRKRRPLQKEKDIAFRAGKVVGRWKMAKHFTLTISEGHFHYERDELAIAREAALDGVYAIRSSLPEPTAGALVKDYKRLATVESAFRSLKSVNLQIRPIRHYKTSRVISHIFLCMLAYYVQWDMKRRLAPMLFAEEDPEGKWAANQHVVHAAARSPAAENKARTKRTEKGGRAMSFESLMAHLGTLCKHEVTPRVGKIQQSFTVLGRKSENQARAFELLGIKVK